MRTYNKLPQLSQLIQHNKPNQPIANALTIDVEDYYMVSAFADIVKFEDWHKYENRVEKNTYTILHLLDEYKAKATFFVLGWIAERCPELVRDIHSTGHEIACHGYNHRLIYNLSPEEFREDVRKAKSILENIIGTHVIGHRAASYSIVQKTMWALDILIDEGFLYDSSIFPIHHDLYGFPEAPRFPYIINRSNGILMEFPPSTYRIFNQNIPVAGGGYLRFLPLQVTKMAVKRINKREKKPVILYLHSWEIDTHQPRLQGKWRSKIRHYINLNSTMSKLRHLLSEFKFNPLATLLAE